GAVAERHGRHSAVGQGPAAHARAGHRLRAAASQTRVAGPSSSTGATSGYSSMSHLGGAARRAKHDFQPGVVECIQLARVPDSTGIVRTNISEGKVAFLVGG